MYYNFMTKNTKKIDTALIGCGYWGTNIAKSLIKIKNLFMLSMRIRVTAKFLKKIFNL